MRKVSREISEVVEAETVMEVEGCMCAVVMRDGDAPPRSRTASGTEGRRRNPGGPTGATGVVARGGAMRGKTIAMHRAEVGSRTRS